MNYLLNRGRTSAIELKKISNRLISASIKSKVDVNISVRVKAKYGNEIAIDIVFYCEDIFCITLYEFYSITRNKKMLDLALKLMKDSSTLKEIKQQFEEVYNDNNDE